MLMDWNSNRGDSPPDHQSVETVPNMSHGAKGAFSRRTEMFRQVVEWAPVAMVAVDTKGRIVLVNAQTEHMFGYGRDELIGKPVELLIPERFAAHHVPL